MMTLKYVKPTQMQLKGHSQFNEKWVQERVAEDPAILGLGSLVLKDVERMQPRAGRLDLLLYNPETDERYELELMLGTVDESHIIRAIEYWDIERKRYPQYDHKAVIVAEEITTRFLNVISLFNQSIPLIAIQMNALQFDDKIILNFTKVLDEIIPGDDDEEETGEALVNREYWEKKPVKNSLPIMDECIAILQSFAPSLKANYRKNFISLKDNERVNNFVRFFPKNSFMRVRVSTPDHQEWRSKLEDAGLVVHNVRFQGRVVFRITSDEIKQHRQLLTDMFQAAYQAQQA